MGFDHITRDSQPQNDICAGASGIRRFKYCNPSPRWYMYIYLHRKNSKYTFQRKSYRVYKVRSLVKPMMNMASEGYIIDILGPYIADGKNNDPAILNVHLSKKEK